ncbi:MAG TPA: hypothetical protein VF688_09720 [Allosphingosinicella sp.]|jgi:hypothetical protein
MQDEAEEPAIETNRKPTRAEVLLVAAAWGLLAVTLFAALRLWSGGSH